jgi:DNA-binding GntR family transcriptional regulator
MSDSLFNQIAPYSKKDRVVLAIREAIVSGKMQPGDAIVEGRVARQLGVGQPLVREALIDLEHQGFVQRVPYKGTSVTKLSPADVEQIQDLRIELESLVVERARARVGPSDIKEMREIVDGMRQAAAKKDLGRFNEHDLAFHRALWQLAGNRYLADALERAVVPLLTFFYLQSGHISEAHVQSVRDHEDIVEGLVVTDPAEARALTRRALGELKQHCDELLPPSMR